MDIIQYTLIASLIIGMVLAAVNDVFVFKLISKSVEHSEEKKQFNADDYTRVKTVTYSTLKQQLRLRRK